MSDQLVSLDISRAHVTLDGDFISHDRVRFETSGIGTFDTILHNITQANPELKIIVRFNVSKKAAPSIPQALVKLSNLDVERRLSIYFSPVYAHFNGTTATGRHAVGFASVREFAEVELNLLDDLEALGYKFRLVVLDTTRPSMFRCEGRRIDDWSLWGNC